MAAELEARCIPFLRALNRIAIRAGGPAGDPGPVLDGLVTAFGKLLDCLHGACAAADPPADFATLPEDRKLRLLFVRYRLSCSTYDEVLSIMTARNRARAASRSALRPLTVRWSQPLLASGARETHGRTLYVEWRRSIR